jgi:hypothetical protein
MVMEYVYSFNPVNQLVESQEAQAGLQVSTGIECNTYTYSSPSTDLGESEKGRCDSQLTNEGTGRAEKTVD